jgi:hypothetical protein
VNDPLPFIGSLYDSCRDQEEEARKYEENYRQKSGNKYVFFNFEQDGKDMGQIVLEVCWLALAVCECV